jgi:hypothetical protein
MNLSKPTSGQGGQSPASSTKPVPTTKSKDQEEKAPLPGTSTWQECTPNGSGGKSDFKTLPFLYRMLLGIFVVEALFLGFSFHACKDLAMHSKPAKTVQEHCPRLGERAENLFGISIATVLSLMTGQAIENFRSKN